MSWGIAGRIGSSSPGTSTGSRDDIAAATDTVTLPADYAGAAVRLTTAVADGMTEGPEEFNIRVTNAVSAGGDTITRDSTAVAILTIRDPAPVTPAPAPSADNPAARRARVKIPTAAIGHGSGDAELTEGSAAAIKTDFTVTTAAVGFALAPKEGVELSATAVHTRAKLDAAAAGGRALPKTAADATRVAASAEFSREFESGARPFLTVRARHDSGDDEQGSAGDLGGGVEWRGPAVHFRLEGAAHVGGDGGEEERFGLTLRRAFGPVNLGLNLGLDGDDFDAGRLLTGEWRF